MSARDLAADARDRFALENARGMVVFFASLSDEQVDKVSPYLTAEQRHQLATARENAGKLAEHELAEAEEADALPRRGTNHTHPPRPGQPCRLCGV